MKLGCLAGIAARGFGSSEWLQEVLATEKVCLGGAGEGAAITEGPSWVEPSAWEHDDALTVYAIHGGAEQPRVIVYDHIEVRSKDAVCGGAWPC